MAGELVIEFIGLDKLAAALRRMASQTGPGVEEGIRELSKLFQSEAASRVPVKTGRLKSSIQTRCEGSIRYVVEATAPYAGYVEYGSTSHLIEPTKSRALRFSIDGRVIYARRVRHPGSAPRPYWRPAYRETVKKAAKVFAGVVWEG
ncbi:MAG: HK97 gp10 family phage protein [Nitrososphaerota archaeon]